MQIDKALIAMVLLSCAGIGPVQAQIATSTFDTDRDGWLIADLSVDDTHVVKNNFVPVFVSPGGNPGGFISMLDPTGTAVWYWKAPPKFLGNVSSAYGKNLSFDNKDSITGVFNEHDDVVLIGGGITLALRFINASDQWTHHDVLLTEAGAWKKGNGSGPLATAGDVHAVLAALDALYIRGDLFEGADTGGLDNVVLGGVPTSPCWADVDHSGAVNMIDVVKVLRVVAGLDPC